MKDNLVDLDLYSYVAESINGSQFEQFVAFWTLANSVTPLMESAVIRSGQTPLSLTPQQFDDSTRAADVETLVTGILRHLTWLDRELGAIPSSVLPFTGSYTGYDQERYRIVRSARFPGVGSHRYSAASSGGSVHSYARFHSCISADVEISSSLFEEEVVGAALALARVEGGVALHSLRTNLEIQSPSMDGVVAQELLRVAVDDVEEERKLEEALRFAADREVTVLVLPELSLGEGVLEGERGVRARFDSYWPIITVAGIAHSEHESGRWVNRAIAVDGSGHVLLNYLKRTRLNFRHLIECHQVGTQPILAPSPWGALAIAICRDIFDPAVSEDLARAAPSAVFVPSLSPKTDEHRTGAERLRAAGPLTATFVANRWGVVGQPMLPAAGPSFALVPGAELSSAGETLVDHAQAGELHVRWSGDGA